MADNSNRSSAGFNPQESSASRRFGGSNFMDDGHVHNVTSRSNGRNCFEANGNRNERSPNKRSINEQLPYSAHHELTNGETTKSPSEHLNTHEQKQIDQKDLIVENNTGAFQGTGSSSKCTITAEGLPIYNYFGNGSEESRPCLPSRVINHRLELDHDSLKLESPWKSHTYGSDSGNSKPEDLVEDFSSIPEVQDGGLFYLPSGGLHPARASGGPSICNGGSHTSEVSSILDIRTGAAVQQLTPSPRPIRGRFSPVSTWSQESISTGLPRPISKRNMNNNHTVTSRALDEEWVNAPEFYPKNSKVVNPKIGPPTVEGAASLLPTDTEQHERDMGLAVAIARSNGKTCGICFEVVVEKEIHERRFGILTECNHCFCLSCIRKWRQARNFENKVVKACPECRLTSNFICPSLYWVETKEEKDTLIGNYKKALAEKECKYFNQGRSSCPFGNKCFYLHALPDGTKTDVGPPIRRRRNHYQDGELGDMLQQMEVWDLLLWDVFDERDDPDEGLVIIQF